MDSSTVSAVIRFDVLTRPWEACNTCNMLIILYYIILYYIIIIYNILASAGRDPVRRAHQALGGM